MITTVIITCALSASIFGATLWRITPANERRWVMLCVIAQLPMSWLMFHAVRLPLDAWLAKMLGEGQPLAWLRTAYAPLTEEPAKLWPLLLPVIARLVTRASVGRFALALGLGFALGEILTVAGLISARQPAVAALPWWQLGGFITERFVTCATHGAMTSLALFVWRKHMGLIPGLLLAMSAHYVANFPITAGQRGWFGPNPQVVQTVLSLWVTVCFLCSIAWLTFLTVGFRRLALFLYGYADCPECGKDYARPLTGLNFGRRRYEPCPHCGKWHWTNRKTVK